MKQFIYKILLITLRLAIAGWMVFTLFLPQYYLPVLPYLLLFFAGTTILIHAFQLHQAKKNMAKFANSNMLISFSKLFLYSLVAILYFILDTENAKVFVVCLMLLYLIFTTFEVISVLKITKRK
jgi:hypothetical protein